MPTLNQSALVRGYGQYLELHPDEDLETPMLPTMDINTELHSPNHPLSFGDQRMRAEELAAKIEVSLVRRRKLFEGDRPSLKEYEARRIVWAIGSIKLNEYDLQISDIAMELNKRMEKDDYGRFIETTTFYQTRNARLVKELKDMRMDIWKDYECFDGVGEISGDTNAEKDAHALHDHRSGSLMNVARAMKNLKEKFDIDGFLLMDNLLTSLEAKYPELARGIDQGLRENRFKNDTAHNYCKVMCIFSDAKNTMKRTIDLAKLEKSVLGGRQAMKNSRQFQVSFEYLGGRVDEFSGSAIPLGGCFMIAGGT